MAIGLATSPPHSHNYIGYNYGDRPGNIPTQCLSRDADTMLPVRHPRAPKLIEDSSHPRPTNIYTHSSRPTNIYTMLDMPSSMLMGPCILDKSRWARHNWDRHPVPCRNKQNLGGTLSALARFNHQLMLTDFTQLTVCILYSGCTI